MLSATLSVHQELFVLFLPIVATLVTVFLTYQEPRCPLSCWHWAHHYFLGPPLCTP